MGFRTLCDRRSSSRGAERGRSAPLMRGMSVIGMLEAAAVVSVAHGMQSALNSKKIAS